MTDPIRTAVVGYGLAGSVFHAPLVAATDGFALAAVVTGNPDRAAAVGARYPGARVVADVDTLLAEPDRLDLVVVASPNRSHVPVALAAVEAGLPVVVDKPVAASVADAATLRAGGFVSVFHNRRWDADALTLRKLVTEGGLGDVRRFESRYERWRPEVKAGVWRERRDPAEAGGLLFDLGSHLVDQALWLFGPVRSVYAEVRAVRPGAQVDDDVFLALTHESGTVSHLWASSAANDLGPRFRVLGSRAAYVKYGMDPQEAALRAGRTPRDPDYGVEPEYAWGRLGTPGETRPVPSERGAYQAYYEGIRDALRHGTPPPVTLDEAIAVLAVLAEARRVAAP
jgi:scyllo-inositol 2-dehydrogenase (NADP+)